MRPAQVEIRSHLLDILGEIKCCDARVSLDQPSDLVHDLGLDSVDMVELAVRLEREYGVILGAQPQDMDALASLDALVALVADRKQ
jgi:acyl carrier protein